MRPGIEIRDGEQIGRDPRDMDAEELKELGHEGGPLLKAIREKCLDCCVYQPSEVRKCTAVNCALWPYRMRSNPFHGRTGNPANAEALAKWREAQKAAELTQEILPKRISRRVRDLRGKVFGRLTVKEFAGLNRHGQATWLCDCACGNSANVSGHHLTRGHTKSCGCAQREFAANVGRNNRTHGLSQTDLYQTWSNMMQRCHNPRCRQFKFYGAREIFVHRAWHDPAVFIADILRIIGPRPAGMELDRINPNSGYRPGNVRRLTAAEQRYNTRSMAALGKKVRALYSELAA